MQWVCYDFSVMNRSFAMILSTGVMLLAGCDDSVSSSYSTREEAEADRLFDRGWLPEIIPPSSREITMTNDLDLNLSKGAFRFDASDHGDFVEYLTRTPANDEDGFLAYAFEDWIFLIGEDRNRCRFVMRLNRSD